ncbi:ribokinase [Proteinivorax tanatarense]|uniref:Ribokinase n=1 Tax=Proteinivorax tanatarense TaxID=1260629 RepID=A0AAU7VL17_9FIRM
MSKVIVVGSINVDLVFKTENHPLPGETVMGKSYCQYNGGKGANQAVAAARLGSSVFMVGAVGNDEYGLSIVKDLKRDNINTKNIVQKGEATGVAAITLDKKAENSIVVIPGANHYLEPNDLPEDLISTNDIVLLQLEISIEMVEQVVKIAKNKGAKVILDPAPVSPLSETIYKHLDIIKPNEGEALKLSQKDNIDDAAQFFLDKGVENVIITLGKNGAKLYSKTTKKIFQGIEVDPVDTTAAGDSFSGALAADLSKGSNLDESIKFAIKVASKTVTKMGAQSSLPILAEVTK